MNCWGLLAGSAFIATSCSPVLDIGASIHPTTQAFVIAIEGNESDWTLHARSRDFVDVPIVVDRDAIEQVIVLEYDRNLDALQLSPGLLETGEPSRHLPLHFTRLIGAGRSLGSFNELSAPPEGIEDLRIARPRDDFCSERGGCVVFESDQELCQTPCGRAETPVRVPAGFTAAEPASPSDVLTSTCPSSDWPNPNLITTSAFAYVRPESTAGDGSLQAPYRTIAEALGSTPSPRTILLSKGDHPGGVIINSETHLLGACRDQTRIVGIDRVAAAIAVEGAVLSVEQAHVIDSRIGIDAKASSHLHLRDVRVGQTDVLGVRIEDSEGDLRDLMIGGAETGFPDRHSAGGLWIERARVQVERLAISQVLDAGLRLHDGELTGYDVSVRMERSSEGGIGLLTEGSVLLISRFEVIDARSYGVIIRKSSTATVTDLLVETSTDAYRGIEAEADTEVTIVRAQVRGSFEVALQAFERVRMFLEDATITNTRSSVRTDSRGAGFFFSESSALYGKRIAVDQAHKIGGEILRSRAEIDGLLITNVTGHDSEASENRGQGLRVVRDSVALLSNAIIVDVREDALGVYSHSLLDLRTGYIADAKSGVIVDKDARIDAEDIEVVRAGMTLNAVENARFLRYRFEGQNCLSVVDLEEVTGRVAFDQGTFDACTIAVRGDTFPSIDSVWFDRTQFISNGKNFSTEL